MDQSLPLVVIHPKQEAIGRDVTHHKVKKSVEYKVEVMPEACRYGVLTAGVGAHCLRFICVECASDTGILRSSSPRLRSTLL